MIAVIRTVSLLRIQFEYVLIGKLKNVELCVEIYAIVHFKRLGSRHIHKEIDIS